MSKVITLDVEDVQLLLEMSRSELDEHDPRVGYWTECFKAFYRVKAIMEADHE